MKVSKLYFPSHVCIHTARAINNCSWGKSGNCAVISRPLAQEPCVNMREKMTSVVFTWLMSYTVNKQTHTQTYGQKYSLDSLKIKPNSYDVSWPLQSHIALVAQKKFIQGKNASSKKTSPWIFGIHWMLLDCSHASAQCPISICDFLGVRERIGFECKFSLMSIV